MLAIKKIIKGRSTTSQIHKMNHPNKIRSEINILKSLSHVSNFFFLSNSLSTGTFPSKCIINIRTFKVLHGSLSNSLSSIES